MGAVESSHAPPRGYVMVEFFEGQRVSYKSPHGFDVTGVIIAKAFAANLGTYVYTIRQDSGQQARGAMPWQLRPLGPPPGVTTVVTQQTIGLPPPAYTPQAQPYPPQAYPPQVYPPQAQPYPPQAYPPQAQPYPPQAQPYPPQAQPYPPQAQPYPPQAQPYPPQGYPPAGAVPPPYDPSAPYPSK